MADQAATKASFLGTVGDVPMQSRLTDSDISTEQFDRASRRFAVETREPRRPFLDRAAPQNGNNDLMDIVEADYTKSGWLSKRGNVNTKLKRRWVTVQNGNLDYFTHQGAFPASGSIPLRGAHVEKSDKENQKDQFFFYLTPADRTEASATKKNEDRVYVFCCETAKEVQEWLNCFEDCDANVLRSLKEGVLLKCNRGLQHWVRRYFILYYDRLVYFKDRTDTAPNGVLLLSTNDISITETVGEKGFMFQIEGAEADDGKTCTLSASTEDDRKDWLSILRKVVTSKGSLKFPGSIQEGYLSQCHRPNWRWGVRYVVMLPGKILYYRHKAEETEEGILDLSGRARLEEAPAGMAKRLRTETKVEFTFSIIEGQEPNARVFYFAAKKRDELEMWLAAFRRNIETTFQNLNPSYSNSLQEGFLKKSDGSLTIWSQRYFALFETRCCYFKSKGDPNAVGEILLPPGFEAIVEPDPANPEYEAVKALSLPYIFSVACSGDEGERRCYLQAADLEERTLWLTWFSAISKAQDRQVKKDSIKEGYVRVGKSKRFCVLFKDKLSLYKRRADDLAERELLLIPGTVVERDNGEGQTSRVVCHEAESDRKLNLDFYTKEFREEWMAVVGGLGFNNLKSRSGCVKEGWGRKLGAKFRTWKARYFVLFDTKLCYYSKLRDVEAAGTIELNFASKVAIDPTEELCLVIENPAWTRVYKLQFDTRDSMTKWLSAILAVIKAFMSGTLFGGKIEEHCKHSPYPVPKICFDIVEKLKTEALDAESLFRVPGNTELIQGGIAAFEGEFKAGKGNLDSPVASCSDPYSLAWIVVLYFRKLRIPLIPPKNLDQLLGVEVEFARLPVSGKYALLATMVDALPTSHRTLLAYFLDLLQKIAARAETNKMSARNLATVLAPVLLRRPFDEHGVPLQDRNEQEVTANVLVLLVEGFSVIFPTGCPSIRVPQRAQREKHREEKIIPLGLSQRFVLNSASDLPEDWQAHASDEGIPYYHNTLTKESTWIRPLDLDEDKAEGKSRIRTGGCRQRSLNAGSVHSASDNSGDSSDDDLSSRVGAFEESASSMLADSTLSELKRLARAKAMEIRKAKKELSNLEDRLSQRESALLPRKSLKDPLLLPQNKLEITSPSKPNSMTPSASYSGSPSSGGLLSRKPPLPPAAAGGAPTKKPGKLAF